MKEKYISDDNEKVIDENTIWCYNNIRKEKTKKGVVPLGIFYIADTHFGHANIMRHCNRPFSTVDEMDEVMIRNWNSVVNKNDDVYIIGDFCFKSGKNPAEYLKRLNGKKHLISGNHDGKVLKDPYVRSLFESIEKYDEIEDNGRRVILFHYPIAEWNGYFRNSYHVFGHIHNKEDNEANKMMKNIKNAFNAGADCIGFYPRTLDQLIEIKKANR